MGLEVLWEQAWEEHRACGGRCGWRSVIDLAVFEGLEYAFMQAVALEGFLGDSPSVGSLDSTFSSLLPTKAAASAEARKDSYEILMPPQCSCQLSSIDKRSF